MKCTVTSIVDYGPECYKVVRFMGPLVELTIRVTDLDGAEVGQEVELLLKKEDDNATE